MGTPILITGILLMLSQSGVVSAQTPKKDSAQEELVVKYVQMVNHDDLEAIMKIIHPLNVSEITPENKDYYEAILERDLKRTIPSKITYKIEPVREAQLADWEKNFNYSVRPSHLMTIEFWEGINKSTAIMRQIGQSEGDWYIILPQPKSETLQAFRRNRWFEIEQERLAREKYQNMDTKLIAEIQRFLKEGKLASAIKLYIKETGEPVAMAKRVIDLVISNMP